MNVRELLEWCEAYGVSHETQIALRAKDDHLLTIDKVLLDTAYFGNCDDGSEYVEKNAPRDAEGEIDHEKMPRFLILDSGRG